MSDINLTNRPGRINTIGSNTALFIPVAADRVHLSYETKVILDSRLEMMTAPAGASHVQIDMLGEAETSYREIGKSILSGTLDGANDTPSNPSGARTTFMQAVNHGKRDVYIDRPIMGGPVFIDDFEGFISTLENGGRTPILSKLGYAIAKDMDIFGLSYLAKGAATTVGGGIDWAASSLPTEFRPTTPGENWVVDANSATDGSALLDGIRQVAEYWDENDVPDDGRVCVLKPAQYNLLVQNQDLLNRDFGGQNGIFSDGTVFRAWGLELVKSNLIAQNMAAGVSGDLVRNPAGYNFNASALTALCFQQEAAVKVRSGGMSLMTKDLGFEYGGHAMVAEMACGYEIKRPLGLGAVATA